MLNRLKALFFISVIYLSTTNKCINPKFLNKYSNLLNATLHPFYSRILKTSNVLYAF